MGVSVNGQAAGNSGFSNIDAAAVTPSSSPFTMTNQSYGLQQVSITGGTISAVTFMRKGTPSTMGLVTNMILLTPGDSITIVFVVAPNILTIQLS